MKKYKTGGFGINLIEEIEISRETDKCVFYLNPSYYDGKEQQRAKRSSWENFWDTWEEAYNFLLEKQEKSVENARNRLSSEIDKLQKIKQLTQPSKEIEE